MLWPALLVTVALLWLCRAALLSWRLSQLLSASTTVQAATLGVRWAEGALEVGVAELRTKPPGAPFAPDVGAVAEAKTVVHLASIFKKVVDVLEVSCRGRKRVIQRRFNVSVPRARVSKTTPTLRERSER